MTADEMEALVGQWERDLALAELILSVLPTESPGATVKELLDCLPEGSDLGQSKLYAALNNGHESKTPRWERTGTGKKNDPYRYHRKAR
jgi:hypothetical protein